MNGKGTCFARSDWLIFTVTIQYPTGQGHKRLSHPEIILQLHMRPSMAVSRWCIRSVWCWKIHSSFLFRIEWNKKETHLTCSSSQKDIRDPEDTKLILISARPLFLILSPAAFNVLIYRRVALLVRLKAKAKCGRDLSFPRSRCIFWVFSFELFRVKTPRYLQIIGSQLIQLMQIRKQILKNTHIVA